MAHKQEQEARSKKSEEQREEMAWVNGEKERKSLLDKKN
jgi:hypothetical protein